MGGHIRGVVTIWRPQSALGYTWNVFGPGQTVSDWPVSYLEFALGAEEDGTRLIGTGNINATKAKIWGTEAAANYKNLYAQAGYFGFALDRRASTLPNPDFAGWYVQGTWILTGEARRYNTASATWSSPRPDKPFSITNGGIGAWELAARYSVLDLNYNQGVLGSNVVAALGGIRGGKQKTATAGVNWYPNNAVRFLFNYERTDIHRLATVAPFGEIGQTVDVLTARAQLQF